jgi:hypothetical protein
MEMIIRGAVVFFLVTLIFFCVMRQRRYWRELSTNRPSGSVRAGYSLSVVCVFLSFLVAVYINTPTMWQLFGSILIMGLVFCVKVTFSPMVLAATLAVCTYQFYFANEFPLWTVWCSFIAVLTWRLPEEVRVVYASLSFLWILLSVILPAKAAAPEASPADQVSDVLDTMSSYHA